MEHESSIPKIYTLPEAAELLGVSIAWLRTQLYSRRFAAMKRAGRWAMTEPQIIAAIDAMTTQVRPLEKPSPTGLSKRSRFRRRLTS
ncbi:hypothetical protein [Mycolicibacterium sp. XJ1904]